MVLGCPAHPRSEKTTVLPTQCKSGNLCDWESDQRLMEGWQVYLDNFTSLSVTSRANLSKAQGQLEKLSPETLAFGVLVQHNLEEMFRFPSKATQGLEILGRSRAGSNR